MTCIDLPLESYLEVLIHAPFTVPLYLSGQGSKTSTDTIFAYAFFQAHAPQKPHLPSKDYSPFASWVASIGKDTMYMANVHCCHMRDRQRIAAKTL